MKKLLALLVSLALIVGCVSVGQIAFAAGTYQITLDGNAANYLAVASSAEEGSTVTISTRPNPTYILKSVTAKTANGATVAISHAPTGARYQYYFTMPGADVVLSVALVRKTSGHWDNAAGDVASNGAVNVRPGQSLTPIFYIDHNPGYVGLTVTLDYDETVFEVADDWNLFVPDAIFFHIFNIINPGNEDPKVKNIVRQDSTTNYTGTGEAFSLNAAIKNNVSPGTYSLTCTIVAKKADNSTYNFVITQDFVVTVKGLSMHVDNAAGDMENNGIIYAHRGETLEMFVYVDENPGQNMISSDVYWYSPILEDRDPDEASSGSITSDLGWEVFTSGTYSKTAIMHNDIHPGWRHVVRGATGMTYQGYASTTNTGVLYSFTVKIPDDAPFNIGASIVLDNISATYSGYGYNQQVLLGTIKNANIQVVPETINVRLDNYNNDMLNNGVIYAYPGQTLTLYTVVEGNTGFSSCMTATFPTSGESSGASVSDISFVNLYQNDSVYGYVGNANALLYDHVEGTQDVLNTFNGYYHEFTSDTPPASLHRFAWQSTQSALQTGNGRMFYDKIKLGDNNFAPGHYTIALRADFEIYDPDTKPGYTSIPFEVGYAEIEVLPEISKDEWNVVRGSSLTLNGTIGLNIYLSPQPDIAASGYVNVKGPNDFDQTYQLSSMTPTANGYRFSVPIYSPQLFEEVELRLYNGNGEIQPIFYQAARLVDDVFMDTVFYYCSRVSASSLDETMKTLASRLGLYMYISYFHFNGAAYPSGLSFPALAGIDVSTLAGFTPIIVGSLPQGITYRGMSLLLKEVTSLRIYFDVTAGTSFPSVMLDGAPATVYTNASGQKYVEIPNIASPYLDTSHSIVIGGGTYVMVVSALSYAQHVLDLYPEPDGSHNEQTMPFISDLVKALYLYNVAANDYFGV